MSGLHRIRLQRTLREAEGYLELDMPQAALQVLSRIESPGTFRGHFAYLQGEAYRSLDRFSESIDWLRKASDFSPSNTHVWLALGWCHKRTGRLDLAIEDLEHALEADASQAIIHYNLACYWSLAGNKKQSLGYLARAIRMDANYRDLAADEHDFDSLREDPEFQALTSVIV